MSPAAREWTVLVTVHQSEAQLPISEDQVRRVLAALGEQDAWIQYPPASGRGHGFETRWWQTGEDAVRVGAEALARYHRAVTAVGIEVDVVLVHVASPEDRLNETVIGLEQRAGTGVGTSEWNATLRAISAPPAERFTRADLRRLLTALPDGGSSGFARDGLVEARFWIDGEDAVDAGERARERFDRGMAGLGRDGWTIVRAHVVSAAEAQRTAYLGVERRMLTRDPATLPVLIRA